MPFWWWPRRRRSRPSSRRKDGPAGAASACCSPRHSVDVVVPPTACASSSASPSPQWERAWHRSLGSPAPPRTAAASTPLCCDGGGGDSGLVRAAAGRGLPLPRPAPVYRSGPQLQMPSSHADAPFAAAARGGSPASSGSSSESDEAADNQSHRYTDRTAYPGSRTMPLDAHKRTMEDKHIVSHSAPREDYKFFEVPATNVQEVHLQSLEASTSRPSSRGRSFHKDTRCARARSLSPSPRKNAFASSFEGPGDLGLSPRSMVKRMDGLKSLSQPLPRPPAPVSSCHTPSFPTCTQFQSQWKKGKLLGSGTFGQVYLGFNSERGRLCAIKEVKVILDDSKAKERLKQLNQEVDILRQLSHQNIVQYYGSELTDEALSIYLEYVSGGSIHRLLRDYGPFKEPVIRNYTRQILSGLAYLHSRNTVHRDIKGANILVSPNGEVKLADFGMAKHITSYAEIHSFRGSPYWMAPEVIMNKNGYSLEVDIWSLGCTVIEMGSGRHPWHPHGDVPAMFKIANTKHIPEIPESFSKEGKDFVSLCLKRDPTQRPSASQLLCHPFLQDHQALRETKCNTTRLRNGLSLPAGACHKKLNKESPLKRGIAPLRNIGGLRGRGFTEFSSAYPSPNKTSSGHINVRANMSLPVSPCSSPLRRVKQSNWSCVASPSHQAFSSASAAYNPVNYMQNQMRGSDSVPDPWHDISHRPQSPYGSPK
ncbi:hypothetical protein HU200_038818 [Digitaria exilis]|uniref:mitogen-activated protein kinase kinase kinase n=1 Tax=Digitaria exilis TaxID=1010633 RepID=A0A835EK05_9POAL|nr:hypothetical protein HU200_038818 [Digitaria exilis]